MELVIVSGIQLLALLVIGAVDYLTNIGAKPVIRRSHHEAFPPLVRTSARQPRPQPDTREQFDRAA